MALIAKPVIGHDSQPVATSFPKIHLNVVLRSWPFYKRLSRQNSVCIPCISPTYRSVDFYAVTILAGLKKSLLKFQINVCHSWIHVLFYHFVLKQCSSFSVRDHPLKIVLYIFTRISESKQNYFSLAM